MVVIRRNIHVIKVVGPDLHIISGRTSGKTRWNSGQTKDGVRVTTYDKMFAKAENFTVLIHGTACHL